MGLRRSSAARGRHRLGEHRRLRWQENHELGALPQHYADMFGWEELARTISAVYLSLPDDERAAARVYASNYGQAGSLEYFARAYPLPPVISAHNN